MAFVLNVGSMPGNGLDGRWAFVVAVAGHLALVAATVVVSGDVRPPMSATPRPMEVRFVAPPRPPAPAAPVVATTSPLPSPPVKMAQKPIRRPPPVVRAPVVPTPTTVETVVAPTAVPVAAAVSPPAPASAAAPPEPPRLVLPRFDAAYLNNPKPIYPPAARRRGETGTVTLRVLVSADGGAARVELKTSSGSPRLDRAAQEAVAQWKFVPARQGDVPVQSWVLVPVDFSLN